MILSKIWKLKFIESKLTIFIMTTVVIVVMRRDRGYLLSRVASANARVLKGSLLSVSQRHSSNNKSSDKRNFFITGNTCKCI